MPRPPALDPLFRSLRSIKGVGPQLGALLNRFFGGESDAIALDLREKLKKALPLSPGASIKVVETPPGPPVLATLLAEITRQRTCFTRRSRKFSVRT